MFSKNQLVLHLRSFDYDNLVRENSINFYDISYLNVKGWYVPKFVWTNFSLFLYSIIAAVVGIIFVSRYAKKQRDEFGKQLPVFYISIGLLIIFKYQDLL